MSESSPIAAWKATISNLSSLVLSNCESWLAGETLAEEGGRDREESWMANANLVYPLGKVDLPAKSSTLAIAAKRLIDAKRSYVFETSSSDGPVEYISFVNAFGFDLCPAICLSRRGSLVLNRSAIGYVVAGTALRVDSSAERRLEVHRSVVTKQVGQANSALPFEHSIHYELRNPTGTELEATELEATLLLETVRIPQPQRARLRPAAELPGGQRLFVDPADQEGRYYGRQLQYTQRRVALLGVFAVRGLRRR